jgi:hypothetical protein
MMMSDDDEKFEIHPTDEEIDEELRQLADDTIYDDYPETEQEANHLMFVKICWQDYYDLLAGSPNSKFSTEKPLAVSSTEEVFAVANLDDANRLIKAFNMLCEADWAPNQSIDDRKYFEERAERANALIKSYRLISIFLENDNNG